MSPRQKSRVELLVQTYFKGYKKWEVCLAVSLLIVAFVFLLSTTNFFKDIEMTVLDYRFRSFPIPERADTNIVIVAIDNRSLDYFSSFGISWPWPRDFYGHVVEYFSYEGARAVVFDILLYEPDIDRFETYAEETDGAFAEAIRRAGNIVLGAELLEFERTIPPHLSKFAIPLESLPVDTDRQYGAIQAPIDTLLGAATAIGITNIFPDRGGIIRRMPVVHELDGKFYPNLSAAAFFLKPETSRAIFSENRFSFGDLSVPVDKNGRFLINWYGSPGPEGVFKYISFGSVIQSASAVLRGDPPSISPGTFKDKYIIIGAYASGLLDFKPTPLTTDDNPYPGMEIWATALSNFLNGNYVIQTPWYINFILLVAVVFATLIIFTRLDPRLSNPLIVVLLAVVIIISLFLWSEYRILLNAVMPGAGLVVGYLYISVVSYLVEGKSKREIRKVFNRYVHPDVIKELLEHPDVVEMGGKEVFATIVFSDIANFTNFSEGKKAPELVEYLNKYLNDLTSFILDHNGLLDKFTGDGIMALFGVPMQSNDHAHSACRAALLHRHYSMNLRKTDGNYSPWDHFHMNTRLGINTGYVVAGNIGSSRRTDYTAIGDDVNLAARLEGVNKVFGTKIIIGQSTYELVKNDFICRELDLLRVKGKNQPVRIYELLKEKVDTTAGEFDWIETFHDALELYRKGDWSEAQSMFQTLADGKFNDPASKTMITRCTYLINNPPEEWDGIITLETK